MQLLGNLGESFLALLITIDVSLLSISRTRAETAQTMAISEVHEKSSESHEKFMRKS